MAPPRELFDLFKRLAKELDALRGEDYAERRLNRVASSDLRELNAALLGGKDPDAEVLILRILEPADRAPESISGRTLTAIANYGDMAVRLTDQLQIPRETLAAAVSAAAARVG